MRESARNTSEVDLSEGQDNSQEVSTDPIEKGGSMADIDEEKMTHVEDIAREMFDDGIDDLEIVEYLTHSWGLTDDEADVLEGMLESWEDDEEA